MWWRRELTASEGFFFDHGQSGRIGNKPLVLENMGSRAIEITQHRVGRPQFHGSISPAR